MAGDTKDAYTAAGKKMLKAIEKLKDKPYVKVGFPMAAFSRRRRETERVIRQDMRAGLSREEAETTNAPKLSVGEIALVHEFGSDDGRIPERSMIRSTHDKNQRAWWELTRSMKIKLLTLQINIPKALGILGETIKTAIQGTIRRGGDPLVPNAPSTIAAKGSTHPLVDSAQMLNSVTYERVNAD